MAMTDEAFAMLVSDDVKRRVSPDQADYLRLPENWDRWRAALVTLLEEVWEQIDEINDQEKAKQAQIENLDEDVAKRLSVETAVAAEERRKKANRFKYYVEKRIAEVDRMIAMGEDGIDESLSLANFLSQAIQTHQRIITEENYDFTEVDEALWAAVEGKWEFGEG